MVYLKCKVSHYLSLYDVSLKGLETRVCMLNSFEHSQQGVTDTQTDNSIS